MDAKQGRKKKRDYSFGEKITTLRRQAKLTQRGLAGMLGVTDKAVSRWENGTAKPTTQTMRKLAEVFHMSLDELMAAKEVPGGKKISKIVLTGGPCAGKTTALSWIKNELSKRGYCVLIVPETATELITGGVAPWTCDTNLRYQQYQMRLQLEKERIFEQAAQYMKENRILIICDRGAIDNRAYMDDLEFSTVLRGIGRNEVELRDTYDAVFHLVTAANGAVEAYTTANNQARRETVEEAVHIDEKLIAAWTGHPHLRIIDNSTPFEEKLHRVVTEILSFLGEPEPMEIERKFLIRYPDLNWLEQQENCERVEILQTYLYSQENEEVRVRQRGSNGHFVYYETKKKEAGGAKRIEIEQRLSYEEYLARLMYADNDRRPIRKARYCLTWDSQYFEIDVYPFWEDRAILEVELYNEEQEIRLPENIQVIREVTGETAYRNSSLSRKIPMEELPDQ
ncbi:MAG: AAA family ATPase [Eubacteriales bacterium]|nr:AAA family ATPase [Eubacteriales bacterium]